MQCFVVGPADGCGGDIYLTSSNSTEIRGTTHTDQDCHWHIATPLGYNVQFQIIELHFPTTTNCLNNYLELRDGYSSLSNLITKICNNTATGNVYTTSKQYGFFRLVTADYLSESPFKIRITAALCMFVQKKKEIWV